MSLFLAPITEVDGRRMAQVGPWAVPLPHHRAGDLDEVVVGIRPEHLSDPRSGHPDGSVGAEVVGEVPAGRATG